MPRVSQTVARFAPVALMTTIVAWQSPSRGQNPTPVPLPQRASNDPASSGSPNFRAFTEKDGIKAASIPTIEFDSQGRLWIGTEVGPCYYDGKEWTALKLPDAHASSWVTSLAAASDGAMWIGTRTNGLWRYRDGSFEHYDARSGLPSDRILSIALAPAAAGGSLWVGTDGGLARLRDQAWTTFSTKNSQLPEDNVTALAPSILPSAGDALWIGTRGGLAHFNKGEWTVYRAGPGSLPDYEIASLLETRDPGGEVGLWIGTRAGGLTRLQHGSFTGYNTANSQIPANSVWSLAETRDASGRAALWVGTYGSGLARLEDGIWTSFHHKNSEFPNNYVVALRTAPVEMGSSSLWAGTGGGGVVRIRHSGWRALTPKHDHVAGEVWGFAETGDASGNPAFWVSGQDGVYRFERRQWTHFSTKNSSLPNDFVPALLVSHSPDHPGALWGATQGGLALFEEGKWSLVASKGHGLPADGVRCLLETQETSGKPALWVGTSLGLSKLQDGTWTTFQTDNSGIGSNAVMSLVQTTSPSAGSSLWIGTIGGGLARLQDGRWTSYVVGNSPIPSNEVMSVAQVRGSGGSRWLWVGTGSAGVGRFNLDQQPATWHTLSSRSQPQLPDDAVYQIVQDGMRRVYLLTNRGVTRLTQHDPSRDDNDAFRVETFTIEDGLPSHEGNARAGYVDRMGRIWVGTTAGAAVFDPVTERPAPPSKTLLLRGGRIPNSDRILAAGDQLSWNQNTLLFDFSLIQLFREGETRYRTQLLGFDPTPSEWTTDGKSRYTNLPAGSYEFRAWGRDYAGNVVGPAVLPFEVRPAPWRTIWAYAAYTLGLLAIGYAVTRARLRALQRRTEVLEVKVRERTAEIQDKNVELDSKNAALAENLQQLQLAQQEAIRQNAELARVNKELLESNYRADRIFSALADALPGTVLDGKYRLDSRIGAGGFAVVFRGTHLSLDRSVAIKVFRPTAGNDSPRELERFRREAVSSCRVDHPNAIQVFDSGISEESIAYMVMELLQGRTLASELKVVPTMSLRRCAEIVVPVCRALAKAHEAGIVHRDIKPGNVFLHQSPEGEVVKLVDFGIAKVLGAEDHVDPTLTNTGNLLGTPLYMAPERFRSRVCDARSDVYSVGVTLYRMIAGALPFEGDVCELVIKQLTEEPRHLSSSSPHVPTEISDLVMSALSKDVDARPGAYDLGVALQKAVDGLTTEVQEAVGQPPERPPQDLAEGSDTARDPRRTPPSGPQSSS